MKAFHLSSAEFILPLATKTDRRDRSGRMLFKTTHQVESQSVHLQETGVLLEQSFQPRF